MTILRLSKAAFPRLPLRRVPHAAVLAVILTAGCVSSLPYDDMPLPTSVEETRKTMASEVNMLKGPFDADALVALALRHDPDLALLREDLNVARAQRRAAFQIRDPELSLSYSGESDSGEQSTRVPSKFVPWIDPIPYTSDFIPTPGWTYSGVDGIWRTAGSSGWTYSPAEGVWQKGPNGTTKWQNTDPSAQWYVNSLAGEILPPGSLPSGFRSVSHSSADGRVVQASLSLYPPNPYAARYRISVADACVLKAQALVRAQEWKLAAKVRRLVETAQYQKEDIASLDVLVLIQKQIVKILEERVMAGAASSVDTMRASWRHLQTISDRDTMARDYAITLKTLAPLTGIASSDLDISPRRTRQPSIDPDKIDRAQIEAIALKNRADLNALVWQLQAARDALGEARTANMPWFSQVRFSYGHTLRDGTTDPDTRWTDSSGNSVVVRDPRLSGNQTTRNAWGVEAGVVLPLFSRLTSQTAPFEADYRRCKTQFSSTWRVILEEVNSAFADAKAAAADMRKYRQESASQLQSLKTMLSNAEGRDDLAPDEVLNIRSTIVDMERTQSRMEFQYRTALITFSEAIGRDLGSLSSKGAPPARSKPKDAVEKPELRDELIRTLSHE